MGWVKNASPEVNAISEYPKIIAIAIVLTILSLLVVGTRLWVRARTRGLAKDDYMAGLAMIFAIAYSALCIAQTRYGLGLPIALRPKANLIPYTRTNYAGRPFYQLGISFFKIALLISYLRLLKGTDQKIYRLTIWFWIALIFLAHLGCTLSLVLACKPVDKSWNPLKPGTCLAAGPSFTGYAIVTIVSDVVVALIPIPILIKLNVRMGQRVGLCGIFLLGLFTTLCSIFRYLQIDRIQHGDGNSTLLVLWGTIEFNVGNIVSSLPFLAPILKRKAKQYYGSSREYSGGAKSGTDKSGEHYGLSNIMRRNTVTGGNHDKTTVVRLSTTGSNDSEERILSSPGGDRSNDLSILKTVSYKVQVTDEEARGRASRQLDKQMEHN